MNLAEISLNGHVFPGAEPGWQKRLEQWRQLLAKCGRKPGKRRVHALRVVTLRLKAELDHLLGEMETDGPLHPIVFRWNKRAGKLRKALSEVRETDVYLAKLKGLRRSLVEPPAYQLRTSRAVLSQMNALERLLERERRTAGRKLVHRIASRSQRLLDASTALEQALHPNSGPITRVEPSEIVRQLAETVAEFPRLDAGNLHPFRKHIKMVRYLAELSPRPDPAVARMAARLRNVQRAIGEWHDWHILAGLAERSLARKKSTHELVETLRSLEGESFEKALTVCEREASRLLSPTGEPNTKSQALPPRRPIRSVEPIDASGARSA